jgi:hypothetical protein
MKTSLALASVLAVPLLSACGEGSKTADVVQAATRGMAEAGQELAAKAAALAELTPEEAKAKLQGLLDSAAVQLKEIKDSETAQRIVAEVERAFDVLVELARKLGEQLDIQGLKASVVELVERFKSDPRVVSALESLAAKLAALGGSAK